MQVKKLTSLVIKPEDAQTVRNFFQYFKLEPTEELEAALEKLTKSDSYSLEDQEKFRIALGEFVTTCDHPVFCFSDKITAIIDNIRERVSQLSFSDQLEEALKEDSPAEPAE